MLKGGLFLSALLLANVPELLENVKGVVWLFLGDFYF